MAIIELGPGFGFGMNYARVEVHSQVTYQLVYCVSSYGTLIGKLHRRVRRVRRLHRQHPAPYALRLPFEEEWSGE